MKMKVNGKKIEEGGMGQVLISQGKRKRILRDREAWLRDSIQNIKFEDDNVASQGTYDRSNRLLNGHKRLAIKDVIPKFKQ